MSNKLNHSNLAVIHYSVFFQACRALGIGFDVNVTKIYLFIFLINNISKNELIKGKTRNNIYFN
jgi:hypothetical protein